MQFSPRSLSVAVFFASSILVAFHADASRASVLRVETQFPAPPSLEPKVEIKPSRPHTIDDHIALAAAEHGVSRRLIRAVIEVESRFDPFAISARGACGLMQLMPGTARRLGVVYCHDARQNIQAGTRLLKTLLIRYDGDIALSIAAYNPGEGAVARYGGIPPYRQTRAYVRNIERLLAASHASDAAGS